MVERTEIEMADQIERCQARFIRIGTGLLPASWDFLIMKISQKMKKVFYIALVSLIFGCGKNSLIINPIDEETQKTEVLYLDESEPVIEFLNPFQTGMMNSEMMSTPGLFVLSYSQFINEIGETFDTTLAYALFRDMSSPPINIGRWQERKGIDIGEIYIENFKLEKSTRKIRMHFGPPHGRMDTSYGFEYVMKTQNFNFKHSSKHRIKVIDKAGREQLFEISTPAKLTIDGSPEYDGKKLKIKFKTKVDSINLILSAISTYNSSTFKPVMMLKIKAPSTSKIELDSSVLSLIPAELRQKELIFSIVQAKKENIRISGYFGDLLTFVSSTLYFRVNLR